MCYPEDAEFEAITDNQVLTNFFSKSDLSSREARGLEFLSQFGITKLTLEKGRVQVLGDALSQEPHASRSSEIKFRNLRSMSVQFSNGYRKTIETDQTYGPIWRALHGSMPRDKIQWERIIRLLVLFKLSDYYLTYNNRICIPRKLVRDLLHSAHDSRISGHFAFQKTLHRLEKFHWKPILRTLDNILQGV